MKASSKSFSLSAAAMSFALALVFTVPAHAKYGATDPIPGTSNGSTNSGGGGGGKGGGGKDSSSPVIVSPTPAPAPGVSQTLTFTPVSPVNGVDPVCTGSYRIDPYYPTLSLMTVNVEVSSVNAPDGSLLYLNVSGTGGTLYPFTSNAVYIVGGYGLSTYSVYVTPGTTITSVKVCDSSGNVISSGN
ncbi:MAG: hypothetical protein QM715_00565 [Nibricoccus sp.]